MKTVLSIPLLVLMLFTGIRVDIGTHYCGGSVAATKVSLDRELASCGMEQSSGCSNPVDIITHRCCEDVVTEFSICNNYFPTVFNAGDSYPTDITLFIVNPDFLIGQTITSSNQYISIRPPGDYSPSSVVLSDICIFRI
jgi:hypothetical protein